MYIVFKLFIPYHALDCLLPDSLKNPFCLFSNIVLVEAVLGYLCSNNSFLGISGQETGCLNSARGEWGRVQ